MRSDDVLPGTMKLTIMDDHFKLEDAHERISNIRWILLYWRMMGTEENAAATLRAIEKVLADFDPSRCV